MKKMLVGFLVVALYAPVAVSALVTCRDTINGCTVEQLVSLAQASYIPNEEKIVVLQELLQKLVVIVTALRTNTNVPHISLVVKEAKQLYGLVDNAGKREAIPTPPRSVVASFTGHFDIGANIPAWDKEGKPYVSFGDGSTDIPAQKLVCPDMAGIDIGCEFEAVHSYAVDGTYTVTVYTVGQQSLGDNGQVGSKRTLKTASVTVGASSTNCFVPVYDLYMGKTDSQTSGEVSKLQLWLKAEGYFPDATGTGYYGEKTAAAVMKWQKAHGMDFVTLKSGVGKQTRAKMQEACEKGSTARSKVTWIIENANPSITDDADYRTYEQVISADVAIGGVTKRYSVGKAYGCADKKTSKLSDGTPILGQVSCYYAATGVSFTAYDRNGKVIIERYDDDASGNTSGKTTVVLDI